MASLSGEKIAGLIVGALTPEDIPAPIRIPFRKFPLPAFRKLYLQGAYWLYGLRDR